LTLKAEKWPEFEFPDILFESHLSTSRLCLVCAKHRASTVLRTVEREIVPVCRDCGADWNFYGYYILKRIKLWTLVRRITYFKAWNCFRRPFIWTIWSDVNELKKWSFKMKKWLKKDRS